MNIEHLVKSQKQKFYRDETLSIDFRRDKLQKLKELIIENESELMDAVKKDFGKSQFEVLSTEISILLAEIKTAQKNLKLWMRPKRVKNFIFNIPSRNYVSNVPRGVSLIIGAWNYPIQLLLAPAIASIAAGNTVILKPSELAINTSNLISQLIPKYFESDYMAVVEGDGSVCQELISQDLDMIFFTGSSQVGSKIMESASKFLTPVVLELGGKSPCIVDSDKNLKLTCEKIAFGKFVNAGQTCVAPDYILINEGLKNKFIDEMKKVIKNFYNNSVESSDYARIINERHFQRLKRLLDNQNILLGGEVDEASRYISPTLIDSPCLSDPIMNEEIFGPILPIITYKDVNECIELIRSKTPPLALYLFTNDNKLKESFFRKVLAGGMCINETIVHLANDHLPFGGVKNSGIGNYHGEYGMKAFSHQKAILDKPSWFNLPIRQPPYTKRNFKLLNYLIKLLYH